MPCECAKPILLNDLAEFEEVRPAENVGLEIRKRWIKHIDLGWVDVQSSSLAKSDEQVPLSRTLKIIPFQVKKHDLISPAQRRAIAFRAQLRQRARIPPISHRSNAKFTSVRTFHLSLRPCGEFSGPARAVLT